MANVVISGDTSGSITLAAPAVSGTTTITMPNTTGTMAYVNATSFLPAYNGSQLTNVNATTLLGRTVGTSANNIVALNASSQLPAVSGALLTNLPATSGALIRAPQILTSGTSYTTPTTCTAIYVEALGGGGGGGGANGSSLSASKGAGGGGAGGGYCAKYFTVSSNTAYTYAIGAGGTATSNAAGGNGGNTTFTVGATTITASGGIGGLKASGTWVEGTAGGTGTNGDVNITGFDGTPTIGAGATNTFIHIYKFGGYSYTQFTNFNPGSSFGAPPAGPFISTGTDAPTPPLVTGTPAAGINATAYGTGGSGGYSVGTTGTAIAGGTGYQGLIRIWEFT